MYGGNMFKIIKKLRNKGFTLIELLAVLVVLSIIALVGYSVIGDVIETSKKQAALESARNYVSAVNLKIMNDTVNGDNIEDGIYDVNDFSVDFEGTRPKSGDIQIAESKVFAANFLLDGFQIKYNIDSGVALVEQQNNSYPNGTVVYFNPTTSKKCTDYSLGNSGSYYTTGCLKWFAYFETDTTVKLLLDHNIDENIEFALIAESLEYKTNFWDQSLEISIMSLADVSKIIGTNIVTSTSITNYSWLYENITGGTYPGYWTSTRSSRGGGWAVADGHVIETTDNYRVDGWRGVRPTITINKSLLND